MDPNASRRGGRSDEADAYWRRRFFALVAGLGVVGLLAWATSGAVGGKTPHQAADSAADGSGNASAAAYGSAAPGDPTGVAGLPSGQPSAPATASISPSATPHATASPSPAQKKSPASQQAKGKSAATTGKAGGGCPARDIVLTLSVSKPAYGPGAHPVFQIDIVSTDATQCAFNTGRTSLRVLITGGTRATWDSGACLRGATAHVEYLRRGVPAVASIGWDRLLRPAGCTTAEVAATPGDYQAMAVSGSVTSPARSFVLR
jgi:hypothetical protein